MDEPADFDMAEVKARCAAADARISATAPRTRTEPRASVYDASATIAALEATIRSHVAEEARLTHALADALRERDEALRGIEARDARAGVNR